MCMCAQSMQFHFCLVHEHIHRKQKSVNIVVCIATAIIISYADMISEKKINQPFDGFVRNYNILDLHGTP